MSMSMSEQRDRVHFICQLIGRTPCLDGAAGECLPDNCYIFELLKLGRDMEPPRVVVEVSGGVAEVTSCPAGVEVEIIDHDNIEREAEQSYGEPGADDEPQTPMPRPKFTGRTI